ncbi:DUF6011 domain-containing protein [Amycolatopsis sp., V23-08]|uniref:DUF6011 domain-containing protein n=1 Tax=Amycolatopsis heterodermiae TaxID=3110235 RepID=A0ABU5RIF3_9PSEU|nr:DUF6011 domain-containing protein [Amycolatopsis sp., V23-08]MEA5366056.1 DUF6011 domain-containing protein [Amycolatopsis sp., V23-08]
MSTRCQRTQCGRKLTDPASQERGYGPVCYRKVHGHGPRLVPITRPPRYTPGVAVPLFELDGAPATNVRPSRDTRRNTRQAEAIRRGYHPLGVALRTNLPLHPDAPRGDDRKTPGPRCGSCTHRVVPLREVSGTYPKCNYGGDWRHATGGPGTDCRAWWPACHHHEPKTDSTTTEGTPR